MSGDSPGARLARRFLSWTGLALATLLATLALALLPLTALADLVLRRRLAWTRAQLALLVYLYAEVIGLAAGLGLTLTRPALGHARWVAAHVALQRRWARGLFAALRALYGLRVEVEGDASGLDGAPLLLISRHASLIDTLLPFVLLPERTLRYVLKRELLWDPCLDLVGLRLRNVFVRRDEAGESQRVTQLGQDLGPKDAIVIFPEGTRFSAGKRARILARLRAANDPELPRAEGLRSLLPPRSGGVGALLAASPELGVLLVTHRGLEAAQTLGDFAGGSLIGRTIEVQLETSRPDEVPRAPEAVREWLWRAWERIDAGLAE